MHKCKPGIRQTQLCDKGGGWLAGPRLSRGDISRSDMNASCLMDRDGEGERRSEHHCRMDIPLSCKSLRCECLPTEKKNHHKVCAHCAIPHASTLCGISAKMYVARERCIFGVVWKCFFLAHHVRFLFFFFNRVAIQAIVNTIRWCRGGFFGGRLFDAGKPCRR